jgi:uncharacterized repeat protein (TIGR01451 family)
LLRGDRLKVSLLGAITIGLGALWYVNPIPIGMRLGLTIGWAFVVLGCLMARFIRLRAGVLTLLMVISAASVFHYDALLSRPAMAADKTIAAGAYIVDMGQATQTVANGLKPYGLVYDLVIKQAIPVEWAINPNKARDGVDFSANGKTYRGSAFIIPAEYAAEATNTINTWKAQGVVVDGPIPSGFTAPIYATITNFPNAVLDFQNGSIAQAYFTNAGIPAAATGIYGSYNTYRFGYPSSLTPCDDVFVMPHADPTWATHRNLIPFVQSQGFVWAACHAVSVLERLDDPGDPDALPDMNFLSHVPPAVQDSLSLKLYGNHANPTAGPYQYASTSTPLPYGYGGTNLWAYPIMQFLGKIDLATQNGSEQIYIPDINGAKWRDASAIATYDDLNTDAVVLPSRGTPPPNSQIKAAKMVFGPAYGNMNNGMVMYEAGHSHAKSSGPDNVAAQRAFFNFLLLNGLVRGIKVNVALPETITAGATVNLATSNNGGPAMMAQGGNGIFSYRWYSNCGGTFNDNTLANPTFTAPNTAGNCSLRVVVTDGCNRRSFGADTTIIVSQPPPPSIVDISVTKIDDLVTRKDLTEVSNNQTISYKITIKNEGNVAIAGVQLRDYVYDGRSPGPGTAWTKGTPNTADDGPADGYDASYTSTVTLGAGNAVYGNRTNNFGGSFNIVNTSGTGALQTLAGAATSTIAEDGTPINWTGLNLNPGESATLTFTKALNSNNNRTYIANVVRAEPLDGSNVLLTTETNKTNNTYYDVNRLVQPQIDLRTTKTVNAANPNVGDQVTYTITFENPTNQNVTNATFTDILPSGVDLVSWACRVTNMGKIENNNRDANNTSLRWTRCTIGGTSATAPHSDNVNPPPNATTITGTTFTDPANRAISGTLNLYERVGNSTPTVVQLTIVGTVRADASGTVTNTVQIAPPSGTSDPDLSNNVASASFTRPVIVTTDLAIAKTDNQTTAVPGEPIGYVITVTNNGPTTVNSLTVQDTLPAAILNPVFTAGTGNYNAATGAWTGLNLAPGQSVVLTLEGTISSSATGTLTNQATVSPPAGIVDSNSNNNTGTDNTTLMPKADLRITKTDGKSAVNPGDPITYTVRVTNNGPSNVSNMGIVDLVPATITGGTWTCAITSGAGACGAASGTGNSINTTLSLSSGAIATYTVSGTVSPSAPNPGTLVNTASITLPPDVTDPDLSNNSSTDTNALPIPTGTADLAIDKTDGQTTSSPGAPITYTITVTNNGPDAVSSVRLDENLPAGINQDETIFSSPGGSYDPVTGEWLFFSPLANGDSAVLFIDSEINVSTSGDLVNTVTVELPPGFTDSNLNNNSSTDQTFVTNATASPELLLVKRITAIGGNPINTYVDDTYDNLATPQNEADADNHPKWPMPLTGGISTYLRGAINAGQVKPGDDIEYTIYFLSSGEAPVTNVHICDLVPSHMTFIPNTFGTSSGINLTLGANGTALTNAQDIDNGEFFPPNMTPTINCAAENQNGAVVVRVVQAPTMLPANLNSPGYGFIRFRARVN